MKQPRALVFLKAARGLAELQAVLPPTHEVVAHGRQGGRIAVGLVRLRLTTAEPWPTLQKCCNLPIGLPRNEHVPNEWCCPAYESFPGAGP